MSHSPFHLQIDPAVLEKFPQAHVLVLYARNIVNPASNEESDAFVKQVIQEAQDTWGEEKPSSHPHIAAWRDVYSAFGSKPKKYLCSAEALIKRVLKDGELPRINFLVDIYNAISVKHVLPLGGEDLDRITSDLYLKIADGSEPFETRSGEVEHPDEGEVIWADDSGVTCRKWNWRQGMRTAMTEETTNAYFVIERLDPHSEAEQMAAANELTAWIRKVSPECEIETEMLEG